MFKKYFILFLFINSFYSFSQKEMILKVTYGKLFSVNNDSLKDKNGLDIKVKNLLLDIKKSTDKVEYTLLVDKDYAKFEYNNVLQEDDFKTTAVNFGGGETFFYDFNKNKIYKKGGTMKDKLVEYNKDSIQWELKNETKDINNYTCYKAIGKTKIYTSKSNIKKEIEYEAWYCPQFNTICGPSEFYGLPGLIFEASQKNASIKFYIKKIEYVEKSKEIDIPKLKIISLEDEYLEYKRIKRNYGL